MIPSHNLHVYEISQFQKEINKENIIHGIIQMSNIKPKKIINAVFIIKEFK